MRRIILALFISILLLSYMHAPPQSDAHACCASNSFISDLTFSPDGRLIAADWNKTTIKLWDVETGSTLQTLMNDDNSPITRIVFSADGKYVLIGSWKISVIWNITTGQKILLQPDTKLPLAGDLIALAFSPDERYALTADDFGARIYATKNGKQLHFFPTEINPDVQTAQITPKENYVLTEGIDPDSQLQSTILWDISSGKRLHTFQNFPLASASPDDNTILTYNPGIILWDSKSYTQVKVLEKSITGYNSIEFSKDGTYFIAGNDQNLLTLWNAQSGLLHTFEPEIYWAKFFPDNKHLLIGAYPTNSDNTTFYVWDMDTRSRVTNVTIDEAQPIVRISPDAKYVAIGVGKRNLRVWNIQTRDEISRFC